MAGNASIAAASNIIASTALQPFRTSSAKRGEVRMMLLGESEKPGGRDPAIPCGYTVRPDGDTLNLYDGAAEHVHRRCDRKHSLDSALAREPRQP